MCVLWVKSIQLALGNLDVSAKWYILQRTKQYLIIYILYVHTTTVLFISLKIGVKEKWEPWVLLNLNSFKKNELEHAFLFIQSMMHFEVISTHYVAHKFLKQTSNSL